MSRKPGGGIALGVSAGESGNGLASLWGAVILSSAPSCGRIPC
jgi:hypothetical protein